MTTTEFSDQFDVLYNNITSNQAPGLNEYEKSVFLTKAEKEIVKNYFTANSKGNNIGQGFDDSAKRQADFSCLMKTTNCTPVLSTPYVQCEDSGGIHTERVAPDDMTFTDLENNPVTTDVFSVGVRYPVTKSGPLYIVSTGTAAYKITDGFPYTTNTGYITITNVNNLSGQIDTRSQIFNFPSDIYIAINESAITATRILQVVPLRYDEYLRLMSKPYKRPVKNQAWRLINSGIKTSETYTKYIEVIAGPNETVTAYNIRYIRTPKPIIVGDLDGMTIDGYKYTNQSSPTAPATEGCELDPVLHEEILQRAVELAKVAWTANGQDNTQMVMQAGQRSE